MGNRVGRAVVLWVAVGITILRPAASSLCVCAPGELFTDVSSDKSTPGCRVECGLRPVSMRRVLGIMSLSRLVWRTLRIGPVVCKRLLLPWTVVHSRHRKWENTGIIPFDVHSPWSCYTLFTLTRQQPLRDSRPSFNSVLRFICSFTRYILWYKLGDDID